jgi:hypothetical protein
MCYTAHMTVDRLKPVIFQAGDSRRLFGERWQALPPPARASGSDSGGNDHEQRLVLRRRERE